MFIVITIHVGIYYHEKIRLEKYIKQEKYHDSRIDSEILCEAKESILSPY